jgi:hypothetical protein
MANKRMVQFLYSKHPKFTVITSEVDFAANGRVVGSSSGLGVYEVVYHSTGTYQLKLNDNYVGLVGVDFTPIAGISATATPVASLVGSTSYVVSTVGNTDWSTLGIDTDYPVVVGMPFVALNVVGSGTGVAKAITPSNISNVMPIGSLSALMTNTAPNYASATGGVGKGSSLYFQTMSPVSSASVVSMVATNPVASSSMMLKLWFRDSSATF